MKRSNLDSDVVTVRAPDGTLRGLTSQDLRNEMSNAKKNAQIRQPDDFEGFEGDQLDLLSLGCSAFPVDFYPNFLSPQEADWLFEQSQQLTWQQNKIRMLGKWLDVPRLEAIYGDNGCDYLYSKTVLLQPLPWTDALQWLRAKVETHTAHRYHIVIGNRYRNGKDSIGWHADKEASMGAEPAIASVSLGATRRFSVKPRGKGGGETRRFDLGHGSLIFMRPGCQSTHVHKISKTAQPVGERINWTFRPHINGTTS